LVDSISELPFSASLGASETDRTTTSVKFLAVEGLTANQIVMPSTSSILTASIISADPIVSPIAYYAASMVLSSFPSDAGAVTEHIFRAISNIIIGVEDGISGFVTGDVTDVKYGMSWGSLSNSTTASFPKGMVVGNDNFNTPSNSNLGDYYSASGLGVNELPRLLFKRAAGTPDDHGDKDVQRPVSQWANAVGGTAATDGYGADATVAAVLSRFTVTSTVTIGPNDDDGTTMKFWVKKHTAWPGDFIIKSADTGEYLRGIDLKGIIDLETQLFHDDYYFNTAEWIIMDNMVLYNLVGSAVTIVPGMKTAAPVTVAAGWTVSASTGVAAVDDVVAEIGAGMLLLLPINTDGAWGANDALGANIGLTGGTDRSDRAINPVSLRLVIPANTQITGSYTVKPLTNFPSGFTFPTGTSQISSHPVWAFFFIFSPN
jgi:hypothetical protein